jgi:hypothetical protein
MLPQMGLCPYMGEDHYDMNALITSAWESLTRTKTHFLVLFLLGIDGVFLVLHCFLFESWLSNPLFSLEKDLGYPEFYQYSKELFIVILFLGVLIKTKSIGYGLWAVLFCYLAADDSFQIHETWGAYLKNQLEIVPAFGLRAQDFGEVMVSAIAAAAFLIPLCFFYLSGSPFFRRATRHLVLLVFALGFFGVLVDLLHIVLSTGRRSKFLLGTLEDGGEMVVMSLLVCYAFLLFRTNGLIGIPSVQYPDPGKSTPVTNENN